MNKKQNLPAFKERLLQLIGEEAPYPWAVRIGLAKATMHGLLGNATPTTGTLLKIAYHSQVSLSWLLTGQGTPFLANAPLPLQSHLQDSIPAESCLAPEFSDPTPLLFLTKWLESTLEIDPNKALLLSVRGDAMEPTLRDGDLMMMNRSDIKVQNDALYLLEIEGELLPKRLQRKLNGALLIKNDNPDYKSETLPPKKQAQLKIIGRVIWIGRRI